MNSMALLLIVLAVMIIGLISRVREQIENAHKRDFLGEYLKKFVAFANHYSEGKPFNGKHYDWLLQNSDEAQERLGAIGLIEYSAPFGRFTASNYPILLNTIPQFGNGSGPHGVDVNMVDAALRRALGQYDRITKGNLRELKNPLRWLSSGVMTLLTLPLLILRDLGLISASLFGKISRSKFLKLLAGSISIIGIAETSLGLIMGKSLVVQTIDQVMKWMGL